MNHRQNRTLRLPHGVREEVHDATGPIEIEWPPGSPALERGGKYPVYSRSGQFAFTVLVSTYRREDEVKVATVVIDRDPDGRLPGIGGAWSARADESGAFGREQVFEPEPSRLGRAIENELIAHDKSQRRMRREQEIVALEVSLARLEQDPDFNAEAGDIQYMRRKLGRWQEEVAA